MKKSLIVILIIIGQAVVAAACAPKVTDQELEQMCNRLAKLRDETLDKSSTQKCIESARKESISKKQALCRISAINVQEYWNRCRTGEARVQKIE